MGLNGNGGDDPEISYNQFLGTSHSRVDQCMPYFFQHRTRGFSEKCHPKEPFESDTHFLDEPPGENDLSIGGRFLDGVICTGRDIHDFPAYHPGSFFRISRRGEILKGKTSSSV